MKRILGILLIWSLLVVAFGEAIGQEWSIGTTITPNSTLQSLGSPPSWQQPGFTLELRSQGIDILNTSLDGDTLLVEVDEWKYNYGGPNVSCAVFGCNSDHKDHKRKRIYINLKTSKVIRNEVGTLQDVKKEVIEKDWIYKLEK